MRVHRALRRLRVGVPLDVLLQRILDIRRVLDEQREALCVQEMVRRRRADLRDLRSVGTGEKREDVVAVVELQNASAECTAEDGRNRIRPNRQP